MSRSPCPGSDGSGKNSISAVRTGVITSDTKIVFRSRSACIHVLIEMSAEMWHFTPSGRLCACHVSRSRTPVALAPFGIEWHLALPPPS